MKSANLSDKKTNMRQFLLLIHVLPLFIQSNAQANSFLHEGKFKHRMGMSSKAYKPDDWEKPYFEKAVKTVFPSDLNKSPEKYKGKLIHLLGIVDSVYTETKNDSVVLTFLLENKYWDYIEDYSIQDEVMFVSPKGDGKFLVTMPSMTLSESEAYKNFPSKQKLFLVYGNFNGTSNNLPLLMAQQVKHIDHYWYSTAIFTYEVKRDSNGEIEKDKKGGVQIVNLSFLKVAKKGQNK
jgi:hypothetical protein